jgi:large subunit ribosomal protein L19e
VSLKSQRRLAANLLGSGESRIWMDPEETTRIESAITRQEVKSLIDSGRIQLLQKKGVSRGRHRLKSGRRKKAGSRKGGQKQGKDAWVPKIRAIRQHLRFLRDKKQLAPASYKLLLGMSKGGAFRSRSHVDEYVKAHQLQRKR